MKRRRFILNTAGLAVGAYTLTSLQEELTESVKKPKALLKGDLIGITGPAGSIWNKEHINKIQEILADMGFKTKLGQTLYEQDGFLAGSDDMRANEFMDMSR